MVYITCVSKVKRYLFITDAAYKNRSITGAHRRFLELVQGIAADNEVVLLGKEIPQLENTCIKREYITEIKNSKLPAHVAGMIELIRGLRRIKKHISYDHAVSFGHSNTICYWLCGYKRIVSLFREDLIAYQEAVNASPLKVLYFRMMEILAVRVSEKIIVQCKNDYASLIRRNKTFCKDVERKVFIQINNANSSWMKPSEKERKVFTNEAVTILFVGGFNDPRKGHHVLLPAVSRLIDEGYPIKLLVAGDGKDLKLYQEEYKDYQSIEFLGRINNVSDYMENADFEIVPSLIDSCPNTVLEALCAGLPVYGSNKGGIPDLLIDPEYMFEPNSEDIYTFIKTKMDSDVINRDAIQQANLRDKLLFNWCERIEAIIDDE